MTTLSNIVANDKYKNSTIMENKIWDIIEECRVGKITTNEATDKVLILYNVSGSNCCKQCKEPVFNNIKMTVQTEMTNYLIANGMSDNQAESVMTETKKEMSGTFNNWDSQIDAYSGQLQNLIKISVKQTALDWLNKNKPMAWFKPMFE
jgi:hypothetical protein